VERQDVREVPIERDAMTEAQLLLRVHEAAALLGIGRSKAYELISRGELPHVRIGDSLRVPRAGLELWIAQMTAPSSHLDHRDERMLSASRGQGGR
jgi:excisionase family DNA binding protein